MRSIWIFLLGCAAVVEFCLLIFMPDLALEAFAVVLLGIVAAGFFLRAPEMFVIGLPAMPVGGLPIMEGMTSASYPQAFLFRTELRNLYLLFAISFYGLFVFVIALTGKRESIFSYYAPIAYGLLLAAGSLATSTLWVRERHLIQQKHVTLG